MALDVGVHDGLEVLEFAVLQEVDDVDLQSWDTIPIIFILYNYYFMQLTTICSVFFILLLLSNEFKEDFFSMFSFFFFFNRFSGACVAACLNLI